MQKNKILISGYYGFGNAGDEAMLTAILESLYEQDPDLDITVISGNPRRTRRTHGIKAISRMNFPKIYNALKKCDLLISGGGSLLQDVTSNRSLYYYLSIMRMAKWLGKKVFLYAQGIGPLHKSGARRAVREVLNNVDAITVRDAGSKELLHEIGVVNSVPIVTADAVLAMHPVDCNIGKILLKKYGVKGIATKVGISVRNWQNCSEYKKEIALAADYFIKEMRCQVIFIPMQFPEDAQVAMEISKMMTSPAYVLKEAYTTAEIMSIIGCMDVVVGIRLHALIFAALMYVPGVGISYDPKIDSFLRTIGEKPCSSINQVNAEMIIESVKEKLLVKEMPEEQRELISDLSRRSAETARLALSLL